MVKTLFAMTLLFLYAVVAVHYVADISTGLVAFMV